MTQMLEFAAGAGAFGDGRHPTTAGVLAALEAIDADAFQPRRAADIGAGSGILSLAMVNHFPCHVWAGEMDRQAFETLHENIQKNGLEARITPVHACGFDHPHLQANAPYDLITMNILADPLLALAADAEAALAPGGALLLSGMLVWQEETVRIAYRALGLELASRLTLGEWVTLVFLKPELA